MKLLDRYMLKNAIVPFLYCFLGFLAIWLVFDLSDNGRDFIDAKVPLRKIAYYYGTQFPAIMVLSLPISLLLALLYSLSRMSRSNEIISMLTAGVGVPRLLAPLMVLGLATTGLSMLLNYRLAPHSEAVKEQVYEQIIKGEDRSVEFKGHLFRDRMELRTWFISKLTLDTASMKGVHIIQQDARGNVTRKYYARRGSYDPATKSWKFRDGKTVDFNAEGDVVGQEKWEEMIKSDWDESPGRITSSKLDPQNLSVDELEDYLDYNKDFPASQLAPYVTQLHHRWALPWACLLVVFVAAPLGIVYSRRGVLAGVATSIFIFAAMLFLSYLFLALGKGSRIPPVFAAWAPNLVFAALGALLLYIRSQNREITLFRPRVTVAGHHGRPKPPETPAP